MPSHRAVFRRSARVGLGALALVGVLSAGSVSAASQKSEDPSPRVAVTIGGASAVVIAANGQLYAFLDRTADNAPVNGGSIRVTAAKTELALKEVSPGVYVSGSYVPLPGRNPLTIAVQSAAGSGQALAELVINQVAVPPPAGNRLRALWFALGLSTLAALGWIVWRDRRRLRLPFVGAGTA